MVKEPDSEADVWWGKGSPNYPMDDRTFLLNRCRAIDFLNFVDRIFVFDGFANWNEAVSCYCCQWGGQAQATQIAGRSLILSLTYIP